MIVLHSFSRFRISEQLETWQALERVRQDFLVVDAFLVNDCDYDEALKNVWAKGILIVVEQDIVAAYEMIKSLFSCDEDWCAYEYAVEYRDNKNPTYVAQNGLG